MCACMFRSDVPLEIPFTGEAHGGATGLDAVRADCGAGVGFLMLLKAGLFGEGLATGALWALEESWEEC
jgi:hypothetical protein